MPSKEYSKLAYAVTTRLAVKLDPVTEKVCAVDGNPEHFEKAVKVPVV